MPIHLTSTKRGLSLLVGFTLLVGLIMPMIAPQASALEPGQSGPVAQWNFTTAPGVAQIPATGGANQTGAVMTNFHNQAPDYSSGSLVLSNWTGEGDKYWMFSLSTTGFADLTFSAAQRSSGTGPRDFKLQYSLDGTTWVDATANQYDASITSNQIFIAVFRSARSCRRRGPGSSEAPAGL